MFRSKEAEAYFLNTYETTFCGVAMPLFDFFRKCMEYPTHIMLRRPAMLLRPKMRQFLDPISVPIPSGPLRGDIALGIARCKELGPRGAQLVSLTLPREDPKHLTGFYASFTYASGDFLAAASGLAHPRHCLWTRDPSEDLAAVGGCLRSRASRICGT